jgi:hypothetical protein
MMFPPPTVSPVCGHRVDDGRLEHRQVSKIPLWLLALAERFFESHQNFTGFDQKVDGARLTKSPGGTGVEGDKEVMRRKPDF